MSEATTPRGGVGGCVGLGGGGGLAARNHLLFIAALAVPRYAFRGAGAAPP